MNDVVVLIPHYNNVEGLYRSISSIEKGEFADILVVDDGSKEVPNVELLKKSFKGRGGVEILALSHNRGIVEALNRGVQIAHDRGYRYICRLDAGDLNLGRRIEKQKNFLDNNPEYVVVGSWVNFVDSSGNRLFTLKHPEEDGPIRQAIFRYNPFVHPATMLRTEALWSVGGYPAEYPALEDWACFLKLSESGKLANLPEVLLSYEVSPNSISTQQRFSQSLSKVRLLADHFAWNRNQFVGLMKSLVLLLMPRGILTCFKRVLYDRG